MMVRSLRNPEYESVQADSLSISGSLSAGEVSIRESLHTDKSLSHHPRIRNWVPATQVVTESDVDVGFTTNAPKEPAAFFYDGTYYLAVAVWDSHGGPSDKEVALLSSTSYDSGFTQISQVTSNSGVYMHAPGLIVDDNDELWIFYSNKDGGTNNVEAKHAPIGMLPSNPGGWTAERNLVSGHRDPGVVRAEDGTYYLVATEDSNHYINRYESTDLVSWSNQTTVKDDNTVQEGPEFVERFDGNGWWLISGARRVATDFDFGGYEAAAYKGDSLTDSRYRGAYRFLGSGQLAGQEQLFHRQRLTHVDYARENTGKELHTADGQTVAFFEGGDGSKFSVGVSGTKETREKTFPYSEPGIGGKFTLDANASLSNSNNYPSWNVPVHDHGDGLEDARTWRYSAPESGLYHCKFQLSLQNTAAGDDIGVFITKNNYNGGTLVNRHREQLDGLNYETVESDATIDLSKTDHVHANVKVFSSTNTLELRSGQKDSHMTITKIG